MRCFPRLIVILTAISIPLSLNASVPDYDLLYEWMDSARHSMEGFSEDFISAYRDAFKAPDPEALLEEEQDLSLTPEDGLVMLPLALRATHLAGSLRIFTDFLVAETLPDFDLVRSVRDRVQELKYQFKFDISEDLREKLNQYESLYDEQLDDVMEYMDEYISNSTTSLYAERVKELVEKNLRQLEDYLEEELDVSGIDLLPNTLDCVGDYSHYWPKDDDEEEGEVGDGVIGTCLIQGAVDSLSGVRSDATFEVSVFEEEFQWERSYSIRLLSMEDN